MHKSLRVLPPIRVVAALCGVIIASSTAVAQPAFRIPLTVTDSSSTSHTARTYIGFHQSATNCIELDTLRGFTDHWSDLFVYGTPYTPDAAEIPAPVCLCLQLVSASYTPAQCRDNLELNVHQYVGQSQVDSFEIRVFGLDPPWNPLVYCVPSVIGEYCDSAVISGTVSDVDQLGDTITVNLRANLVETGGRFTSYPTRASDVLRRFKLYVHHPKAPPPPPAQVRLVSPIDGATNQPLDPPLRWNAVALAQSYKYQLAIDPLFGSIIAEATTTDTSKQVPGLQALTTYYWRIAVTTPYGMSYYQNPLWDFTTGSAVGVDDNSAALPSAFVLSQNYPNPFNPATTIEYALPSAAHVRLVLYDLLGQEIQVLVDSHQDAGYKVATFDASSLPSGVYLYKLTAGTVAAVRTMLVMK